MAHPKAVVLTYRALMKDCKTISKFFHQREACDLKSFAFSEKYSENIRLSIPLRFVESIFTTNKFSEIVKFSYRNYYRTRTKEERYEEYIKRKRERESFIERNGIKFDDINTHFKSNLKRIIDEYTVQNPEPISTLSTLFDLYLRQEELQEINSNRLEHIDNYLLLPKEGRDKIDNERLNFAFSALRANSDVISFIRKNHSFPQPKHDIGSVIKHKTQGFLLFYNNKMEIIFIIIVI